jgi:outer membrane protein assembly factor BamB
MAGATVITLGGVAGREKYSINTVWSVPAKAALSLNTTDLTGDKQRDLFVQDADGIRLLDGQGQALLKKQLPPPLATTQGDLDGDDVPDIVAYTWNGERATVTAFTGQDKMLWQQEFTNFDGPGRAAMADFENDGQNEIVIGDQNGRLLALSAQGDELWRSDLLAGDTLRGLDDVSLPDGDVVTAGQEGGLVITLDGQGQEMWRTIAGGGLRRLRSFPLGGPLEGRVLVGGVNGKLSVHQGDDVQDLWIASLGQAVNEIRPAEVDGDPATTEVIAGGKNGGVWAFSQDGQRLWSNNVGSKVTEIGDLDSADLGLVVIIGDDDGGVTVFDSTGSQLDSFQAQGSVGRIEVGKLDGVKGFIVADASQMTLYTLDKTTAPFWYTPILGGLLACVVIAIVAYIAASLKPAPTLRVSADEMTVEAQKARRRMLHESIEDLKKIQDRGEVSGPAYLARMKKLRSQLAQVNEALIKLGQPVQVESFACPHCGGPLELGTDRCEYCGQVVIT